MTSTSHKTRKSEAIAACLQLAAIHFGTTAMDILHDTRKKNSPSHQARRMIYLHLHGQGMSLEAIGRIFGRTSADPIRRGIKEALKFCAAHENLRAAFPPIPSTLISTACARFEKRNP